jgi:UPF0716 protein FxsA
MTMLFVPLLLLAWPLAELYVVIKVAEAIGVLDTIVLLIAGWPIGSWAVRSQGRSALRRLAPAIAEGRSPAREVLDGALILIGGALLIVPGFITDAAGIVLLLPPTRALMRRLVSRNLRSRVIVRAVRFGGGRRASDVDSTATDIDQPQLPA